MSTAVVITGLYRTFDKCFDNINNNIILPNNADVFIIISENPPDENKFKYIKNLKKIYILDEEDKKILNKKEKFDKMNEKIIKFKDVLDTEYREMNNYYSYTGIQFVALKKIKDIIEEHEANIGSKYKYIIKIRTDVTHVDKFIAKKLFSNKDDKKNISAELKKRNIKYNEKDLTFLNFIFSEFGGIRNYIDNFKNSSLNFDEVKGFKGRFKSYLENNSTKTLGGPYFYNKKTIDLYENNCNVNKEDIIYMVNDFTIIFERSKLDLISNSIYTLGNHYEDDNLFFWTPEYQLFKHLTDDINTYIFVKLSECCLLR